MLRFINEIFLHSYMIRGKLAQGQKCARSCIRTTYFVAYVNSKFLTFRLRNNDSSVEIGSETRLLHSCCEINRLSQVK